MPRKRSVDGAASVLSSAETETDDSSFSSTTPFVLPAAPPTSSSVSKTKQEGWMYWKRDCECWMKVFVALRKQFLWLTRSAAASSRASPLIQIAVADVVKTSARGFRVTGACHETMELYLYGDMHADQWLEALQVAAQVTQADLRQLEQAPRPPRPLRCYFSDRSVDPTRAYRGTLVVYHEQCKANAWKRFWGSFHLRQALRKRFEDVIDRFTEPSSSSVSLSATAVATTRLRHR